MQLSFSRLPEEVSLDDWCKQSEARSSLRVVPNIKRMIQGLIRQTIDYGSIEHQAYVFAECRFFGNSVSPVVHISTRGCNYYLFHDARAWFCGAEITHPVTMRIDAQTERLSDEFRRSKDIPKKLLLPDVTIGANQFSCKIDSYTGLILLFSTLHADRPARTKQRQIA